MLVWISAYIKSTKGMRSLDVALMEKNGAHEFKKKSDANENLFGKFWRLFWNSEEGTRTCKKGSQRTSFFLLLSISPLLKITKTFFQLSSFSFLLFKFH